MLPKLSPHEGELQYNMDLGQNDSVYKKTKNLTLTIARNSRQKSTKDNLMMPNVRFCKLVLRTISIKELEKGSKLSVQMITKLLIRGFRLKITQI